ncbi:hypothetical protein [Mycolicibacterium fortuitum]|uniref:hypothetical protein n=1 Tax=Mycolicibacterium fortuitum TaxID=1766 RepID=UPI003AAAA22B
MSIFGNLSDLAHEIRSGVGTVLTILGSKLEADARARVECGPQWLTEFEEQRDSLAPAEVCEFHGPWCAGEASWCHHLKDSAAVSAAADPSPTVPNAHSVVGDCPGSDSVILPTVEPGPQTSHPPSYQEAVSEAHPRNHVWLWEYDASGRSCKLCGYVDRSFPAPVVVAGESPREEDEQPSLGEPGCSCWVGRDPACPEHNDRAAEPVSFDDLAAHIMGDFTSGQECDPLTATLIDGLASLIAHSLLADFNITKK